MFASTQQRIGLLGGILGVYLLAYFMQAHFLLNCDASWFMHIAQRLLAGGSYKQDFFEINPPMIFYLYIPPVMLASHFSVSIIDSFYTYIFLLASFSLFLCIQLTQKIFSPQHSFHSFLFSMALAVTFFIAPSYEFGQREHLLIILTMPYLLAVVYQLQGHRINSFKLAAIGLLAGLGFGLKPFFLITFGLIEIYYIFHTRNLRAWLRVETLAIFGILIAYTLVIFIFYQDYLTVILPFALNYYNHGYGTTYHNVILSRLMLSFCFPVLCYLILYRKNPYRILSTVLLIALMGFLCSHVIQHVRLYYHLLPALSIEILLLTLLLSIFVTQSPQSRNTYIYAGLLGTFILISTPGLNNEIFTIFVFHPAEFYSYFAGSFAILLYSALPKKHFYQTGIYILFIICASYLFSSLLKTTSWYEHRLALDFLFFIILFSLFLPEKNKFHYIFSALFWMLVFFFPVNNIFNNFWMFTNYKKLYEPLIYFMSTHGAHEPVYFLTTSPMDTFPTVDYAKAIPVTKVQAFGWLRGIVLHSKFGTDKILTPPQIKNRNFFINMVSDDLNTSKPKWVFVDVQRYKWGLDDFDFDYLSYFSQNQAFKMAWQAYRYFTTIEQSPVYKYQVYQRVEQEAPIHL